MIEKIHENKGRKLGITKKDVQDIVVSFGKIFLVIYLAFGFWAGGTTLYESLLLLIIFIFIKYFIHIKKAKLNLNQRITLLLTLAIAFFAVVQVWVAFYAIIPRVYTSNFRCPDYLIITPDGPNGYGNFSLNLGNYGQLPAWFYQDFQNTTTSVSVGINQFKGGIVLLPIGYENNKQTEYVFNFRIEGNESILGFKLRYLVFGDDIVDKADSFIKKSLNMLNELSCKYEKIDNIRYNLIEGQ